MASSHERRKRKSLERREQLAGQPRRPPRDGDRRRRAFGQTVREALKLKALMREPDPDRLIDELSVNPLAVPNQDDPSGPTE